MEMVFRGRRKKDIRFLRQDMCGTSLRCPTEHHRMCRTNQNNTLHRNALLLKNLSSQKPTVLVAQPLHHVNSVRVNPCGTETEGLWVVSGHP